MCFESYAMRINTLREDVDCKREGKKNTQKRLQVRNTNMTMTSVNKVQFASLNGKRYYFSDGIVSLPFGHPSLNWVREYKKSLSKIHTVIANEKNKILQLQNKAVNDNERLRILRSIFSQPITYYTLETNRRYVNKNKKFDYTPTRGYILNSQWLYKWKTIFIMGNLVVIF